MNKFEQLALINWADKKNIGGADLQVIAEIMEATPNATVALELLLGVFDEPKIPLAPVGKIGYSNRKLIAFESYNKFKDEVTYKYCVAKEKTAWVLKGSKEELMFSMLEGPITDWEPNAYAKQLGITVEEVRKDYERVTVHDTPDETKSLTATTSRETWMGK